MASNTTQNYAIEIDNLVVSYKSKRTLDGISLRVCSGSIFAYLGPNGAGKSTTIKALLGIIRGDSGKVLIQGLPPSNPQARAGIGYVPEEAHYERFLSPMEILEFYGKLSGVDKLTLKKRSVEWLDKLGLGAVKNKHLSTFSKGMVQKVSLAQALVSDPQVLIFDEPTSGLDPLARLELRNLLVELRSQGKTIFFSSHELSEAELICDSMAILKNGRILKNGALQEVLSAAGENLEQYFIETISAS